MHKYGYVQNGNNQKDLLIFRTHYQNKGLRFDKKEQRTKVITSTNIY